MMEISMVGVAARFWALLLALTMIAAPIQAARAETAANPPVGAELLGHWTDSTALFPAKAGDLQGWGKRRWIEKTARLLRGGEGLGPDDDVAALSALPDEAILRRFMADPRFGDTLLDFNLYFLGFKPDTLKTGGEYHRGVFDFANAIAAAQAAMKGGDYFKLFDLEGPLYLAPLRVVPEDPPGPQDAALSQTQLRAKAIGEVRAALAGVLALANGPKRPNGHRFCAAMANLVGRRNQIRDALLRAFNDAEIFVLTRGQVLTAPFDAIAFAVDDECEGQPEEHVDVPYLAGELKKAMERLDRVFAEIVKFDPAVYKPRSVGEFRAFDLAAMPDGRPWLALGYEQALALANSSTNLNRKRAAYVLKRFFCEDVVASPPKPQQHASGAESGCSACHNKLDPMAGFFRNHGAQFFDYGRMPAIVFDDLAFKNRAEYEGAWRAPAAAGREWNIGYVRNAATPGGTLPGQSIADLSRIIRTAPEVKRCVVRRLFEYMVADNQMLEDGYLDHLTKEFAREAEADSSAALKNTIVRIALGRTFREADPDPRRCYDYAPGVSPERMPPCRVTYILRKNCTGCHDSTYDGDGSLDLGGWIEAPDRRTRTFPHLDPALEQRSPEYTLTHIIERLAARDPKKQMPKNRSMRADERAELSEWARQELARLRQRSAQ